jgi:sulfite exporter TauE/SafE
MDFGIAFALGLLGSLHCAAMCGPLMLALPVLPGSPMRFVGGRLIYQFGRVTTYVSLGVVGGIVGKSLFVIGAQRWLSIALGVAVLLGFFVAKKIFAAGPVSRFVAMLKTVMSGQLQRRNFRSLALLGMLNGLLPCGLVYAALAGAVAQGTVGRSLLYMAIFGLGTLPTMLAASISGKIFPFALRLKLRRLIPVGVCALAGLLILRGLALGIPYVSPDLATSVSGCCAH